MIGAPVLALLLHSGLDLAFCAVAASVFTILVWTELGRWLLPTGREKRSGGSAFVIFLAEGAILDWGALFLSQTQGVALANAGIGYAFFSAAMLLMRLSGGPVIERIGPRAAVMGGAVLAGCAFAAAVLFENAYVTFLAFFVVGIGCSNISPLSYAEASRTRVMPMSQALTAVTTLGYTGILTGSALLGFIAKVTSLPMVFRVVGALTVVVATAGGLYSGRTPKASGK